MSVHRLLYVSQSRIEPNIAKGAIASILLAAYRNNDELAVTGALAYSGSHFAQVLEGDENIVEQLYSKIALDPLHSNLQVISRRSCRARLFVGWTMAYCGTTGNIQKLIDELLSTGDVLAAMNFEQQLTKLVELRNVGADRETSRPAPSLGRRSGLRLSAPFPARTPARSPLSRAFG